MNFNVGLEYTEYKKKDFILENHGHKMKACWSLKPSSEILMHAKKFTIDVIPTKDGGYFCCHLRQRAPAVSTA